MELTDLIWLAVGMIIGYFILKPMFVFKWHPREAGSVSKNEHSGNYYCVIGEEHCASFNSTNKIECKDCVCYHKQ